MDIDHIKVRPFWSKTKEQIWQEKFEVLEDAPRGFRFLARRTLPYAAAVLILLTVGTSLFFHRKVVYSPYGEHLAVVLPDGSDVILNADSKIEYRPYAWYFSKQLKLEGEAYFEVVKGRRFDVRTDQARISVLGTQFNVFSRHQVLQVACISGKVKVETSRQVAVLTPEKHCRVGSDRQLILESSSRIEDLAAWKEGNFHFSDAPLEDVLQEVERQYDIQIIRPANMNLSYTGSFSMDRKVDEVLEIIGTPFAMKLRYNE